MKSFFVHLRVRDSTMHFAFTYLILLTAMLLSSFYRLREDNLQGD